MIESKNNSTKTFTSLPLFPLLLLAVCISVCLYASLQSKSYPINPDSVDTYYAYKIGWDTYKSIRQEWRPRLFSMVLAGLVFPVSDDGRRKRVEQYEFSHTFGLWVAIWFFSISVVYIVFEKNSAALFMFLTFVTIITAYTGIGGEDGHRPWDLTILFFATLSVFSALKGETHRLLFILPFATGFKETAIVFCLLYLLNDTLTWKRRICMSTLTAALCMVVKLGIDLVSDNPSPLLTMTTSDAMTAGTYRLWENLAIMSSLKGLLYLLIINAGTLIALLALPLNPRQMVFKTIFLIFAASLFIFARIVEIRIWFEMLPVALGGITLWLRGRDANA